TSANLPANANLSLIEGGGTILVINPITLSGTGGLTLTGSVGINSAIVSGSGGVAVNGPSTLAQSITTSAGVVTFNGNVSLGSGASINTAAAGAGNDIHFAGTVSGGGQNLALNAGTAGNVQFDQTVSGVNQLSIGTANNV